MANKTLFSSIKSKFTRTDTVNEAGGRAYKFAPKHALAQLAATGCFNGTFYASGESQLDELRTLIDQVDDDVFDTAIDITESSSHYGRIEIGLSTRHIDNTIAHARQKASAIALLEMALTEAWR